MIREYGPIALIPAAWAMTFATMIYPGISTYWIQHMHYFMLLFLGGFTVLSWKEMGSDPVLDIWRKVIGAGVIFTGLGALSFTFQEYSTVFSGLSLGYWLIAPGVGSYLSARDMSDYAREYRGVGYSGLTALLLAFTGVFSGFETVTASGFLLAAVSQSYSIFIAAKLDDNI
jgi:hypothetical protein